MRERKKVFARKAVTRRGGKHLLLQLIAIREETPHFNSPHTHTQTQACSAKQCTQAHNYGNQQCALFKGAIRKKVAEHLSVDLEQGNGETKTEHWWGRTEKKEITLERNNCSLHVQRSSTKPYFTFKVL